MGLDLGRKSCIEWVESAPEKLGSERIATNDKFVVEVPIGKGGMGEVFMVRDRDLKRQVAMKILRRDRGISRDARLRFIAEAQATSQLEHPGIPPVHDLGLTPDGQLYFTMKLVGGRTLRDVLRDLALNEPALVKEYTLHKLVSILEGICETVHFAHEKGVIHRDLKPENIMLGDYGEVQVVDWGLARLADAPQEPGSGRVSTSRDDAGFKTQIGWIKGTLAYMSPEQLRSEPLDPRSDVYALGCLLYEMLALRPAFDNSDPMIHARKLVGSVRDVSEVGHGRPIPESLAVECRRAMALEPEARHASADALARSLRAWLDGTSERERRHREADRLAEKGREAAERFQEAENAANGAVVEAREAATRLPAWMPLAEKRPLLDARKKAERLHVQAALAFADAVNHLEAALLAEAENVRARDILAQLWERRLEEAERRRDAAEAAFALEMIARFRRSPLQNEGTLTLASEPPGARTVLFRYRDEDGILIPREVSELGTTPLGPIALEAGSYLCILSHPGFRDTRYPVQIERARAWEGTVTLRTDAEIGSEFVYVPAGAYLSGEEEDTHRVDVDDFAIARRPVTLREYVEFLDALPTEEAARRRPRTDFDGPYVERDSAGTWRILPVLVEGAARQHCIARYGEDFEWHLPALAVDWDDAASYCDWKSRTTGSEWRLPTRWEREKAARGVDGRRFPWGEIEDASLGKCRDSRAFGSQPEPVGAFPTAVSPYGMEDASGGVLDWTSTPKGPHSRHVSGGSWVTPPRGLRCGFSPSVLTRIRQTYLGLRCARSLPPRRTPEGGAGVTERG